MPCDVIIALSTYSYRIDLLRTWHKLKIVFNRPSNENIIIFSRAIWNVGRGQPVATAVTAATVAADDDTNIRVSIRRKARKLEHFAFYKVTMKPIYNNNNSHDYIYILK